MPVRIRRGNGPSISASRCAFGAPAPARREGALDQRVRRNAPDFLKLQEAGLISARQIADSLNENGIKNAAGKPWAAKTIYRMLKRGKQLGLPFALRSPSQAATERIPDYSSRAWKRTQRDAAFATLAAKLSSHGESDPLVTARNGQALSDDETGCAS